MGIKDDLGSDIKKRMVKTIWNSEEYTIAERSIVAVAPELERMEALVKAQGERIDEQDAQLRRLFKWAEKVNPDVDP